MLLVFNKPRASGVIIGKNKYLYEENYIKAYHGTDYIGYDSIMNRMQREICSGYIIETRQKYYLDFAAGKGSFIPNISQMSTLQKKDNQLRNTPPTSTTIRYLSYRF